jgi:hypothetical protein
LYGGGGKLLDFLGEAAGGSGEAGGDLPTHGQHLGILGGLGRGPAFLGDFVGGDHVCQVAVRDDQAGDLFEGSAAFGWVGDDAQHLAGTGQG